MTPRATSGDHPDIARVAALLADHSRASMLFALTDDRALPASMLAVEAGVSASTASEHLTKLVDGGLVTVEQQGRYRYFRLAGPEVATVVETLAAIAPPTEVNGLRAYDRLKRLRSARTCYDHLAGRFGTRLLRWLTENEAIERIDGRAGTGRSPEDRLSSTVKDAPYRLGARADDVFGHWGIDTEQLAHGRRPLIRACVDWTEQSHHLAGSLGASILTSFTDHGWVTATTRPREVAITSSGQTALAEILDQ